MRYVLRDKEKVSHRTPYQLEMVLYTGDNGAEIKELFQNNKSLEIVHFVKDNIELYDGDTKFWYFCPIMINDYIGYSMDNEVYNFHSYEFDELYKLDGEVF